jgi:peptidoglycan/LPS O-acetylase OafA/YrhL
MSVLVLAPMTAVIATLAAKDLRGVPSVNASALMVWLGNISFAFYLVQFPVMVVITRFLIVGGSYGGIGWLGWSALCLVVAMSIGAAVYRWLDEPLMRRFAGRRQIRNPASDAGARIAPIVVLDIQSQGSATR